MSRLPAYALWALGALAPAAAALADEANASADLGSKGLKKVGSYWILSAEQELQERLKSLAPRQRELALALKSRAAFDQDRERKRTALQSAVAERRRLALLALQADDEEDLEEVAARLAVLSNQIDMMSRYVNDSGPSEQLNRQIGQAGDALHGEMHALRKLVNEAQQRYEELAGDAEVTVALKALSEASGRAVKLGPRRVFARSIEELERFEATVRSADIKLRSEQGIFWIEAVLNGTTHAEMVFDTGASLVCLPAELARRAGVTPTESDPEVRMQVADGRTITGRLVFLSEVRVGEFAAANVEAVVLPAEAGDATPLLGGSFLRQFSIDFNQSAGTLRLTRIAAAPATPLSDR